MNRISCFVALAFTIAAPAAAQDRAQAFVGARIIPIEGGVIDDGTLVVQGGRIVSVGRRDQVEVPAGATSHDVSGMEIGRIGRQYMLWKLLPLWSIGDEPGWGYIFNLSLRHKLGYPISYLTERFSGPWMKLLTGYRRTRARLFPDPQRRRTGRKAS